MTKGRFSVRFLKRLPAFLTSEPYEVFFSVALFISGMADLIEPSTAGAFNRLLPLWQVYGWGGALVTGSFLTLVGILLSSKAATLHQLRKFRFVESTGQSVMAVATALWAVVIFSIGAIALVSGLFTLFFSLVCVVKALVLRGVEEYITEEFSTAERSEDDS